MLLLLFVFFHFIFCVEQNVSYRFTHSTIYEMQRTLANIKSNRNQNRFSPSHCLQLFCLCFLSPFSEALTIVFHFRSFELFFFCFFVVVYFISMITSPNVNFVFALCASEWYGCLWRQRRRSVQIEYIWRTVATPTESTQNHRFLYCDRAICLLRWRKWETRPNRKKQNTEKLKREKKNKKLFYETKSNSFGAIIWK